MFLTCGGPLTRYALLIFVVCKCTLAMAGFAEIPANVTVELGTAMPPSRCRHTSSDAFITWRVNGSSLGRFPDIRSGSVNESGTIVYTLTIPAEPRYNGTMVECLAVLFGGSPNEVSPAATIVFTPATTHFEITPTNTPPVTFEITPSPLTVAVEQGTATFQCQHPLADTIGWKVNGIPLSVATLQNVSAVNIGTPPNGVASTLSIATLLVYNGITVECMRTFINESLPQFTTPATLLIQDSPKQVENATYQRDYFKDKLTTLWNPLPSFDINDTDPDILYTVELYQITCGQNILINRTEVAGSNVTEEDLDLMQIYKAVIAARNNVREARSGPSVQMKEAFMSLNGRTLLNLTRSLQINIPSGVPVPSYYEMILESLDGREDLVTNITVERNGEMIDMSVEESVPPNSLWRASILAYGCESDRIVTNYELSTYDIQNIVASSQFSGQISVTGELISGATATGMLVIVYSLSNSNDIHYIAKQIEVDRITVNVTSLTGAEYGVSTFAVENGLPLPGVVASPKNIAVNIQQDRAPQQPPAPLVEYYHTSNSSHTCITCTFLNSSTTGCVAVVHQNVSQLSSSGLVNIRACHKFNRSGDTAYGCIEGVNLDQYQIGVIGGKFKMIVELEPKVHNQRESSIAGAIIGVIGGVVIAAIVAVTVAVILYMRWYSIVTHRSDSQAQTIVNIENGSRSATENHYAELAGKSPEEQPLVTPHRVTADGAEHETHTSPTSDNGASDRTDRSAEEHPPPLPPRLMASADQNTSPSPAAGDPTYAPVFAKSHRVEADGESTPPVSEWAAQDTSASPHQVTSDNGADPTYTAVLTTTPNIVSQPAATEKVSYEDIQKYQNQQGQHYALPQLKITSKGGVVDDLHQVVYTEVKPHTMTQTEDQNIDCTSDRANNTVAPPPAVPPHEPVAICEPLTTDQLYSFLLPHASKWQSLGLALSLDEDRLDEVFTNNETDEACLREMLELYMMRSDLDHSWEKVRTAREKVQAALEKMESSSDLSTSAQEVSSPQNSPVISGGTIIIPDMENTKADVHHDQQSSEGKEESSGHDKQEGNSDSDYSSSQLSESESTESSDSNVVLEMDNGSLSLSQASSEEQSQANEKNGTTHIISLSGDLKGQLSQSAVESKNHAEQGENSDFGYFSQPCEWESSGSKVVLEDEDVTTKINRPTLNLNISVSLLENLEDFESGLEPSPGNQPTLTDGGIDDHRPCTIEEELFVLVPCTPTKSCPSAGSSYLEVKGFCEKPEDQSNNDDLCKIVPVHCQDSHAHNDYKKALMHQMRRNAIAMVQIGNDHLHQQVECTSKSSDHGQRHVIPTTTAIDIPKVHNLPLSTLLCHPNTLIN